MAKKKDNTLLYVGLGAAALFIISKVANKPDVVSGLSDYDKQLLEEFIFSGIDGDGYDVVLKNDKDKIKFVIDTFKSEYGWAIKRYGLRGAIKEWLQGLPSSISIPYTYYDIERFAKAVQILPSNATEKEIDKFNDKYWDFMANALLEIAKEYKVKTY